MGDELQKSHMQALFESGRDLAGMLASRDDWNFGQWDAVLDSGSEESQMGLLVFPALFSSEKCVRQGDLGGGGKGGAKFAEPLQSTGKINKSHLDNLHGKLPDLLTSSIRPQTSQAIKVSNPENSSFGRSCLPRRGSKTSRYKEKGRSG